jgi:solute carrier family 25 (mitochondrial oxoglutarate transporter), member 11
MGCISGGIGSAVGTPAELALVRMSNDSKLPVAQRQNYKGVVDCIRRIAKEDGILGLWNGATVTVVRAMVLSSAVLAITSECKLKLKATGIFGPDGNLFQGLPLLVTAIFISSFFANIFSNPFDVVKSRTQQQSKMGVKKYSGMLDCFVKIVSEEGFVMLFAGFLPAFLKLAPYTIISLLLTEKITFLVTGGAAL